MSKRVATAQKSSQREGARLERRTGTKWTPLPEMGKEAALQAMVEELGNLSALTHPQLTKLADEVSSAEAVTAMKRLKKLEASKPTAGEIGRGALVGSTLVPMASLVSRAIQGPMGRAGGKILASGGRAWWPGVRPLLASSGYGGVFSGLVPAARHKLERGAEKQKLKEFVGSNKRGKVRGTVKKYLGV